MVEIDESKLQKGNIKLMLGTMLLVVGFSIVATNQNVHVLSFLVGNRTTETLDSGNSDMNCTW